MVVKWCRQWHPPLIWKPGNEGQGKAEGTWMGGSDHGLRQNLHLSATTCCECDLDLLVHLQEAQFLPL